MMDTIFIRELKVQAVIGIYPAERERKQPVVVDLEIDVDMQRIAKVDAIDATVDYEALVKTVLTFIEASRYQLLETLAEKTAAFILSEFKSMTRLRLTLRKPNALSQTPQVGVTLERHTL